MKFRRFGRTGLQISELAFGCGAQGGILINADDDTRRAAVRRALDAGINWFDTAAQYGQGKSEEALGWLLTEIPEKPHLSTKVMVEGAAGDLAGQVERSVHASLKRLKRDSVDLLQLHSHIGTTRDRRGVTVDDVLGPGGVADAMEALRQQGLTRFLGLSALGDAACTIRVIDSGRFDTAQVYYNMLNPSAARPMPPAWRGFDGSGLFDACKRHDMGIMAVRIFAAGYLATPVRTGRESILTADTDPAEETRMAEAAFAALGDRYGSRSQTAVRFALSQPDIATAIIGLATLEHLEEALAGADMGPLPADGTAALETLYRTGFNG